MDTWAICGQNGTINGTIFTANCKNTSERVAAYGKQLISKGIAEWKIRYNITGSQCCREIGISDNTEILNNYIQSKAYVWHDSTIYAKGSSKGTIENIDKNNDIITIKLDLNKNKLSFYKNNDMNKMVIVDVEPHKTWRLAAHIDTTGQSFSIISFKLIDTDTWAICGQNGTINGAKFTANCKSISERVAAYGKQLISKGVAEWKIKYNITGNQCCREIGVSDNTEILNNYIQSKAYVWQNSTIYAKGVDKGSVENIDKNNDIVSIKLDLNENKLSFYKNNDMNKMVIMDIEPDRTWRLAAHLDTAGQSFSIVSFDLIDEFVEKKEMEELFDADETESKSSCDKDDVASNNASKMEAIDTWAICGQNGTINGTTFTANCKTVSERVAAYGKELISKGIAEWKIRYNITSGQCCREIGISDNTEILNGYINSKACVWYNSSGIYVKGSSHGTVENIDKNDDIITIKLDLNANKLSFHKNNDISKMVTVDIEPGKTWRLAAHIDTAGQSFSIESSKYL